MALQITPTERHALQLLANGYTTNDVATDLGMGTVETEVLLKRLLAALGAATSVEAVEVARKRGLVSWDVGSYQPGNDAGVASVARPIPLLKSAPAQSIHDAPTRRSPRPV
jgi:DNA-binding CsgD family transcriptional regulator